MNQIIEKKLGIWMDHASAHFVDASDNPIAINSIQSKFTHQEKEHSLNKSENLMHHKEQHLQADYYKKISEVILKFDHIVLFGPTQAKAELFNFLKENHHFDKIKIHLQQTNKMTDSEMNLFTRNYFSIFA